MTSTDRPTSRTLCLQGGGSGRRKDYEGDAVMHHSQDNRAGHGVETSIGTKQEDQDYSIMRASLEKNPCLPLQRVLDRLSNMVIDHYRIRLFDSSRLHGLESSANDFRTEHDFFIDVFFKHRWYNRNHKLEGSMLMEAWNSFIHNVSEIGHES